MVDNFIANLEKIPYTDILCFDNYFYRNLIYKLQKILEFIADDGQDNLAKSIFNVNYVNSLECLVAEDKYDINLRLYKSRSFMRDHIRLYYLDKELEREPNDIVSIGYTTKVNHNGSEKQMTYNTFIFGREVEDDKYLINLFANIVKKEIDLRFYEETGFGIMYPNFVSNPLDPNNCKLDFIDLFDLSWNYINKYIEADFILHLYGTYFKILDEVLDLKYDQFDMVYNNKASLYGETEYEIIKKIYDTAISHEPLYTDEMHKFVYNKFDIPASCWVPLERMI